MLRLVALHTLILALASFYNVQTISGKICCNNISALKQASKTRKYKALRPRAIRTCKCKVTMALKYKHVRAHQNEIKPWSMLTLAEQLNVICDELAKGAVLWYLSDVTQEGRESQLLPLEKAAIVINGEKSTTNVGQALGYKEARRFYTKARTKNGLTNTGGLRWSEH